MDFTKELLNQASKIGELIGDNILILRDELYVNEYIMGMFINVVPQLKSANLGSDTLEIRVDTTKDLTNRKKGKDGRFAYFEQGELNIFYLANRKKNPILYQ